MVYRNYFFIVTLLIVTAFFSWKFYFYDYCQPQDFNIYTFPRTIKDWTSHDLQFDKKDMAMLGSNSILSRRYSGPGGKRIDLYIVYSFNNPKAVTPPELSYTDPDLSILDKGKKLTKISAPGYDVKVNWLILDNDKNQQLVYYWFKGGGIYTSSYWKQQLLIAFNNIRGRKTGSALIRISTDMVGERKQDAVALINEFTALIVPLLSQYLP